MQQRTRKKIKYYGKIVGGKKIQSKNPIKVIKTSCPSQLNKCYIRRKRTRVPFESSSFTIFDHGVGVKSEKSYKLKLPVQKLSCLVNKMFHTRNGKR